MYRISISYKTIYKNKNMKINQNGLHYSVVKSLTPAAQKH